MRLPFDSAGLPHLNAAQFIKSESLKQYLLSVLFLINILTLILTALAIQSYDPVLIATTGGIMFGSLALRSILTSKGQLRPSTLIAATFALQFAFANAIAISSYDKPWESQYLVYAVPEFFFTASLIGVVGGLSLWLGVSLTEQRNALAEGKASLLHVRLVVPAHKARGIILIVLFVSVILNTFAPIEKLGTISDMVAMVPIFCTFLWARTLDLKERTGWIVLYILILSLGLQGVFFSYLRLTMLMPVVFATLGLIYRHGIHFLRSTRVLPLLIPLILFALIFHAFEDIRATSSAGLGRYDAIKEQLATAKKDEEQLSLIGRISTVNQLTQVVRLTDDNGFYNGSTLDYLGYVFIPRFVWPDKPLIAKGQWFAAQINGGRWLETGLFSNSINMTIPGEFYLNFGWLGLVLGCFLVGGILGLIHRAVAAGGVYDLVGGAILSYVLWVAATIGADIQTLFSLLAMYLLFVSISFLLQVAKSFGRHSQDPFNGYLSPRP